MKNKPILDEVASYYDAKLSEHGNTPRGVDWNGEESQTLRFEQLCKLVTEETFSLNDLGCGYGAMVDYLHVRFPNATYHGIDISEAMIQAAQQHYTNQKNVHFHVADKPPTKADYTVASGVFNVRQQRSDGEWLAYIHQTLDVLNESSSCGFSFNCLTSYSDADKKRDYLYYADPCAIFDFCKKHYSRNVALLHDYGLYEFTILVRKP